MTSLDDLSVQGIPAATQNPSTGMLPKKAQEDCASVFAAVKGRTADILDLLALTSDDDDKAGRDDGPPGVVVVFVGECMHILSTRQATKVSEARARMRRTFTKLLKPTDLPGCWERGPEGGDKIDGGPLSGAISWIHTWRDCYAHIWSKLRVIRAIVSRTLRGRPDPFSGSRIKDRAHLPNERNSITSLKMD